MFYLELHCVITLYAFCHSQEHITCHGSMDGMHVNMHAGICIKIFTKLDQLLCDNDALALS